MRTALVAFTVDPSGRIRASSGELSLVLGQRPAGRGEAAFVCHADVRIWDLADGRPACRADCPLLAACAQGVPRVVDRLVAAGEPGRPARLLALAAPSDRGDFQVVHLLAFSDTLDQLTKAEQRVFALMLAGRGTEEIGRILAVRTSTVRTHIRRILEKTGAGRRIEAIRRTLDGGGVPPF